MKKIITFILALCIVSSLFNCAYAEEKNYAQKFSDVGKGHWAFKYIAEMAERGVLSGYPDGKFYPEAQVTRAEFAKIMTIAAGLTLKKPTSQVFADVPITEWYASYIHTAEAYLSAYSQGGAKYYLPNVPALREDIAVALVKLKGYSTSKTDATAISGMFTDYKTISENARIYVATAVKNGLISGYDNGTFRGQNSITRAEAATLLWRAYQYGNDNKTFGGSTSETLVTSDKPYVMRKLASADIKSSSMATIYSDNNIYYIDSNDNCVYKIDISNGQKVKYMDTNKLSYKKYDNVEKVTVAEYTFFVPTQVFYDSMGDRLLLIGYYRNVSEVYKDPRTHETKAFIYDISNNKEEMYVQLDKDGTYCIQAVLNDERIVLSSYAGSCYILDVENGSLDDIYMRFYNSWVQGNEHTQYLLCVSGMVYNHRLFGFNDGCICEYDFSQDKNNEKSDYIYKRAAFGIKDDCYYFWDKQIIYKISVKNGEVTVLDINTRNNNVKFEDGYNLKNIDYKFFVIDDSTIVFYDTEMKAFRILSKNGGY